MQLGHDRHIFQILLQRLGRTPCVHAGFLYAVIETATMQKHGIVWDGHMIQRSRLSRRDDALSEFG